jgi:hypothetical protein
LAGEAVKKLFCRSWSIFVTQRLHSQIHWAQNIPARFAAYLPFQAQSLAVGLALKMRTVYSVLALAGFGKCFFYMKGMSTTTNSFSSGCKTLARAFASEGTRR